jgi:hypothetical protein
MAWQKIDSAPKTDTHIILGFFPDRLGSKVVPISWSGWGGGIWQNATSGMNIMGHGPTHWQPLPSPPPED